MSACFSKIKRKYQLQFPETLQKILIASSFDSEEAILGINAEIISDIERFVNENKNILNGTEYSTIVQNNQIFKFKPGHRSALNYVVKSLTDKVGSCKVPKANCCNEEELKNLLIKKLSKFSLDNSLDLNFNTTLFSNYHIEKSQPKLKIQCPLCSKKYTGYFTTYWNISNYEKHLKTHFTEVQVEHIEISNNNVILSYHNDDQLDEI